jgi:glycosyltransferase involved in cell wall biosynthesis
MKLLICTQIVDKDHPILGFFHRWIEEFAKNCEEVHVICLQKGQYSLPANVYVYSLGKETGNSKVVQLLNFFKYIWTLRKRYDNVFVHMNQIYVILGAPLWRLFKKHIGLWYAHGAVSHSLKIAEKFVHSIITSTSEGFRLESKKIHLVGQGIDTRQFSYRENFHDLHKLRIVFVGRISPVKQCEVLIEAVRILRDKSVICSAVLIGEPSTKEYYNELQEQCQKHGLENVVKFIDGVKNTDVITYLREADVFANTSVTGSLDKTGLEALSAGVPVVTANEAYAELFGQYHERLMYSKGSAGELAERILALHMASDRQSIISELSKKVHNSYDIKAFATKVLKVLF